MTYFYDLPEFDPDLFKLAIDNKHARDTLILSLIPVGTEIAKKYQRQSGLSFADLQGEALLGITAACNLLSEVSHGNYLGFICRHAHGRCWKYIKSFSDSYNKRVRWPLTESSAISYTDISASIVLQEILDNLPNTDIEFKIIDLRLQGLTDEEIAAELEVSRPYVNQIRSRLLKRFLKRYE